MKLFLFAHKFEASVFINKMNFSKTESAGLYKNSSDLLLLTGQGLKKSESRLSEILESYGEISEILNFGICGNLGREQIAKTVEVGKVVLRDSLESITLGDSEIICLTSPTPVMEREQSLALSHYAHIVDMELWSYATVAAHYGILLRSFKTISDSADESTKQLDFKAKASQWAEELFLHYSCLFKNSTKP